MIAAAHQPNFFPWLGFFTKLACCDTFILLDDIQIIKTGGSWTNRVSIKVADAAVFITAPLSRSYHGLLDIKDVHYSTEPHWRDKLLKTIRQNYSRAKYYKEIINDIEELMPHPGANLLKSNTNAIKQLAEKLGIHTTMRLSSEFDCAAHRSTARLICLTQAAGCSVYLAGDGAVAYQDNMSFAQAGIDTYSMKFDHPLYEQCKGPFIPGLSVIDAAMHIGFEQAGIHCMRKAEKILLDKTRGSNNA